MYPPPDKVCICISIHLTVDWTNNNPPTQPKVGEWHGVTLLYMPHIKTRYDSVHTVDRINMPCNVVVTKTLTNMNFGCFYSLLSWPWTLCESFLISVFSLSLSSRQAVEKKYHPDGRFKNHVYIYIKRLHAYHTNWEQNYPLNMFVQYKENYI